VEATKPTGDPQAWDPVSIWVRLGVGQCILVLGRSPRFDLAQIAHSIRPFKIQPNFYPQDHQCSAESGLNNLGNSNVGFVFDTGFILPCLGAGGTSKDGILDRSWLAN
jgi:hypothetical protein